jgi:hypothetical protein
MTFCDMKRRAWSKYDMNSPGYPNAALPVVCQIDCYGL